MAYNLYKFLHCLYWYHVGYQHGNGYGYTHKKLNGRHFPVMAWYQKHWKPGTKETYKNYLKS